MTRPFNFPKEKQQCVFCGRKRVSINRQRLLVCPYHIRSLKKYSQYEVIKIYEEILAGHRKQFPLGFWKFDGKRHAKILIRYLIEEKLRLKNIERFPSWFTRFFLQEYKLLSMLHVGFHSLHAVINNAYPGRFKPWQMAYISENYWKQQKHRIEAVHWLIHERLHIRRLGDVPKNLTSASFYEHNLGGILDNFHKRWYFDAIEEAYPGRFHPWEFRWAPKRYWEGEQGKRHVREATKWLIEEKLKIPISQIPTTITTRFLRKHRLTRVLVACNNSPAVVIENAYPGRFKPEEFRRRRKNR
ncbi:DUF4046 domain-containing protein [Candidatus Woesearchaeota archaeon]|nr:DUF4046 domain-containing protein [Candidatus Woesearchaeota archaeon]